MKKIFYLIMVMALVIFSANPTNAQGISAAAQAVQYISIGEEVSVTEHQVNAGGRMINYTATSGYMILGDEAENPKGKIFFTYYADKANKDPKDRPITFIYNGGPGSSSVWLHMGGLGPRRILMTDNGEAMEPPYEVVPSEYTWLTHSDLVFIDPMETGYSRPVAGESKAQFTGFQNDITSMGDFIRAFTSKYERWNSPKYLSGESYGTTRSAGLSGYLQDRYGMYLNGIILISSVLDFSTILFDRGNELPFVVNLPTYAATAWYHKKLDPSITDLPKFLEEVREFAKGEYTVALMQGDQISDADRRNINSKLQKYTGLSEGYIDRTNLRINIGKFTKELRREEKMTVGRLDGRITGLDYDYVGESYEYDPSYNGAIYGPFSMAINDYLKRDLKVEINQAYEILTGRPRPWSYANVENKYLNVAETLRSAMTRNQSLKVLVINGYYDLATPFGGTEYTIDHMFLDKSLRGNIEMKYYESGHMVYIHKPSLEQMTIDVRDFFERSSGN